MNREEIEEQIAALEEQIASMRHTLDNPPSPKDVMFPDVHVRLVGEDGNAFFILGRVTKAMKQAGIDDVHIKRFREEAMSGDYSHLLRTVTEWVTTY